MSEHHWMPRPGRVFSETCQHHSTGCRSCFLELLPQHSRPPRWRPFEALCRVGGYLWDHTTSSFMQPAPHEVLVYQTGAMNQCSCHRRRNTLAPVRVASNSRAFGWIELQNWVAAHCHGNILKGCSSFTLTIENNIRSQARSCNVN